MLVCERWTLTQSSGWSAGLAGLELALLLAPLPGLLPGLAAMTASREAETVAAAELCDDDADAEPVADGELVADVDADADDGAPEPGLGVGLTLVGGGDSGVLLDVLPDAGAVGEAEADVDEPEGETVTASGWRSTGVAWVCSPSAAPRTWYRCSRWRRRRQGAAGSARAQQGRAGLHRARPCGARPAREHAEGQEAPG